MIVDDFGKVVNHNLPDGQWQTIPVVVISDLDELMLDDGKYCPGVSSCVFELQIEARLHEMVLTDIHVASKQPFSSPGGYLMAKWIIPGSWSCRNKTFSSF